MSSVTPWSSLWTALKNLIKQPFVLVPFVSITLGTIIFVSVYNGQLAKYEVENWKTISYGKAYNQTHPYLGPLPYAYEWSQEWRGRSRSQEWEHARDTAITELNNRFLKRYNTLFWIRATPSTRHVKIRISPAPDFLYEAGKACEHFKASDPSPDIMGELASLKTEWIRETNTLLRANIFICDRKYEQGLLLREKIDKNKVRRTLKILGKHGVLMHEFAHTLLGLAHPLKCMLMCRSPRGLKFSTHTWKILDKTMKQHREQR